MLLTLLLVVLVVIVLVLAGVVTTGRVRRARHTGPVAYMDSMRTRR